MVCTHEKGRDLLESVWYVHTKREGTCWKAYGMYTREGKGLARKRMVCVHEKGRDLLESVWYAHTKRQGTC